MNATGVPCENVKKLPKWPHYKKCSQVPTTLQNVLVDETKGEYKQHFLCGDCVTENVHLIKN